MGNQACCGRGDTEDDQNVHLDYDKVKDLTSTPKLPPPVQEFIRRQTPFGEQLKDCRLENKIRQLGDQIYEGPLNFMNKPNGYGKIYKTDGSLYIGRFDGGNMVDKFYYILPNGSHYYGSTQKTYIHNGTFTEESDKKKVDYDGEFLHHLYHGKGKQTTNQYTYVGEYSHGKKTKGKLTWKNMDLKYEYQGEFDINQHFSKKGKLTEAQGVYTGQFLNGLKHGKGVYVFKNGLRYEGDYVNGVKNGYGKILNADGSPCYQGNFLKGLPHGKGRAYNEKKVEIPGEFAEGLPSKDYQLLKSSGETKSK